MGKFFKELLKGFKWVIIALIILAALIALWIGCAWSLGWVVHRYVDLKNFSPENFIPFGSVVLVFTLIIQIITIILTLWALLAWGRARGVIKKPSFTDSLLKKDKDATN